jgi:hypothetical protein
VLLAAAAAAAVPLAHAANSWITRHGGYRLGPNRYGLLPWSQIVRNAPTVWQSFLALFGADYVGMTGWPVAIAFVHFIGVAVVLAAVLFAAWRLLIPRREERAGDPAAGPGNPDLVHDDGELGAVAALPGGHDDGEGLLARHDRQVELDGEPAAGPAHRVIGRLGRACPARRLLLPAAVPAGAGGVLVRPCDGRVDRDIPGHVPGRVGQGLQRSQQPLPGAVALPAAEQPVNRLPGTVFRGDVAPRGAGPDPPADPVQQPP